METRVRRYCAMSYVAKQFLQAFFTPVVLLVLFSSTHSLAQQLTETPPLYTPAPTLSWQEKEEEEEAGLSTKNTVLLLTIIVIFVIVLIIVAIKFCSSSGFCDKKSIDGTGHRARNAQARRALERERWTGTTDPTAESLPDHEVDEMTSGPSHTSSEPGGGANQRWSLGKLTHRAAKRALRLVSFLGLSGSKNNSSGRQRPQDTAEEMRAAPHQDTQSLAIIVTPPSILISSHRSGGGEGEENFASLPEEQERTPLIPAEVTAIRAFSPAVSTSASLSNSLRQRHNNNGGTSNSNKLSASDEEQHRSPLCIINPLTSSTRGAKSSPSFGLHLHPRDQPGMKKKNALPQHLSSGVNIDDHHQRHMMEDSLQIASCSTEIDHKE